ncbi:hypothetical protein [Halobiforma nitratireducens]|nr:hypothetical protein [Halobiforma nitratireducens]
MATLSPAVLLAGFCAVLAAVAIGRLVAADRRDPVDIGTALLTVSITFGVVVWATVEESWLTWSTRGIVAVLAVATGVAGLGILAGRWYRPLGGRSREDDFETNDERS